MLVDGVDDEGAAGGNDGGAAGKDDEGAAGNDATDRDDPAAEAEIDVGRRNGRAALSDG